MIGTWTREEEQRYFYVLEERERHQRARRQFFIGAIIGLLVTLAATWLIME